MAYWLLLAVTVVAPLALAPGLLLFDVTPKLLAVVVGACLIWLALAFEGRFPSFHERPWSLLLLAIIGLTAIVATTFSMDPVLSLAGSEWRRMGLPAWLGCLAVAAAIPYAARTDNQRRGLLIAVALSGVAAGFYSFGQYLDWDPWIPSSLYHLMENGQEIVRPPSTFGQATYFATFELLAGFAAAGLALSSKSAAARLAWGAAAVVMLLAVIGSGTRGAWLGAAAGAVLLSARLEQRRMVLAGLLVATALGAGFIASPWGQPVRNRILYRTADPGGLARIPMWRDSLQLVAAHPLLGAGPDTFQISFPRYESIEMAQRSPDSYVESPHNVILDYWTTAGLPAVLAFLALMGVALRNGLRGSVEDAAAAAGLAAALVAAQFIADTNATRLAVLTFASLLAGRGRATASVEPRVRAVAMVAITALLLPVLYFGWRMAAADRAGLASADALAFGDLAKGRDLSREAHEAFPWTGTYAFAYSRKLGHLVMESKAPLADRAPLVQAAEEAARLALPHSTKKPAVYVHLASLHVFQGRNDEAQRDLEAAVEAAPSWYRPRWLLAAMYADRRQFQKAATLAESAIERGAGIYPYIVEASSKMRVQAVNKSR